MEYSGKGILDAENKNIYIIMNKPVGYVCSAVSDSHKTVYQLLSPELQLLVKGAKRGHRLHTVGRLDSDTSGLLIFTTDGQFSHYFTSPENNIEKTYEVELRDSVEYELQKEYIQYVKEGVILPADKKAAEEKAGSGKLEFLDTYKCRITITEGKFHQVRRTSLAAGNYVEKLKRLSIGSLQLPSETELPAGTYREMTTEEINLLYKR